MSTQVLPSKPRRFHMMIGGRRVDAGTGKRFSSFSPAHEKEIGSYPQAGEPEVDLAVTAARKAFDQGPWPRASGAERSMLLQRVADGIHERLEELALFETLESGKPIAQARGEMETAVNLWNYAATLARHCYGDSYNNLGTDKLGLVLRDPLGVVGMITPWNFPLLIISQKLPFALAAGNTAVIKPSELTPATTLLLGEIIETAGIPESVVNILTGYGQPVGARLSEHTDVDMLSFTGSTAVGKRVVAASGSNLKKVSLELGGKNPQIVFPDADLEAALDAVVFGVYFNMGECCNSGSRLLVHRDIASSFLDRVIEHARTVPVGDPLDEKTKVGAIINQAQFDKIMGYIETGQHEGAQLRLGGDRLTTPRGRFIEPTVFAGVTPEMEIARQEIFGPVLSVVPFDTTEEAISIANSTMYGLSAGVWSRDIDTSFRMARGIRAGTVWINCFMDGHPELPFGGYRESGLGRELGRFSIDEFTELKTVQLHLGPRTEWWHNG